jgi:hypothetical protein
VPVTASFIMLALSRSPAAPRPFAPGNANYRQFKRSKRAAISPPQTKSISSWAFPCYGTLDPV